MRVPFDGLLFIVILDGYARLLRGASLEGERRARVQEASAGSGRTNAGAEAISP